MVVGFAAVIAAIMVKALRFPRPAAPNVVVTFDGYVQKSGLPVFRISNASPLLIAYSGRYRIQVQSNENWSSLATPWASAGEEIAPGESASFTLNPPFEARSWRVEFEVLAHGYLDGKGARMLNALGQQIGLSLVKPEAYLQFSPPVTNTFAEVMAKVHQSADENQK